MPDNHFPLLLSQAAQAHLGFVKDMRKGTIMLGDAKEYLEVVRQKGTGLFMVRVDHLDLRCYAEAIGDEDRANKLILPDEVLLELDAEFKSKHNLTAKDQESLPAPGASSSQDTNWTLAGCDEGKSLTKSIYAYSGSCATMDGAETSKEYHSNCYLRGLELRRLRIQRVSW